jgi:hypothetical protein
LWILDASLSRTFDFAAAQALLPVVNHQILPGGCRPLWLSEADFSAAVVI